MGEKAVRSGAGICIALLNQDVRCVCMRDSALAFFGMTEGKEGSLISITQISTFYSLSKTLCCFCSSVAQGLRYLGKLRELFSSRVSIWAGLGWAEVLVHGPWSMVVEPLSSPSRRMAELHARSFDA